MPKPSKLFTTFFFTALFVALAFSASSQAENDAEPSDVVTISTSEAQSFEGIGTYNRGNDEYLGPDFWDETNRSDLMQLYKAMPAVSSNPAVQSLIRRSLLSRANARGIINDIDIFPGHDLLTIRLEKLLEAGLYQDAKELYLSLDEPPKYDRLVRAGMLAMLFSGEKGLVCIDSKTFTDQFETGSFVHLVDAYCSVSALKTPPPEAQALLENSKLTLLKTLAKQSGLEVGYNSNDFSKLSIFEQALVIAENRLDLSGLRANDINAIPPAHLPFLLDSKTAPDNVQFLMTLKALKWGYDYKEQLATLYMNALPASSGDLSINDAKSNLEKLAILFDKTRNTDGDQNKWQQINQAIIAARPIGATALVPFTEEIAYIDPEDTITPQTTNFIYEVFLRANQPLPRHWESARLPFQTRETPDKTDSEHLKQLVIQYFLENSDRDKQDVAIKIQPFLKDQNNKTQFFLENIIEKIDKPADIIHNPDKVYEKAFYLTLSQDYVMPSVQVWNRLNDAAKNRSITQTVLLSMIIIRDEEIQTMYPGFLEALLSTLNTVGLTDVSNELAIYATLRSIT